MSRAKKKRLCAVHSSRNQSKTEHNNNNNGNHIKPPSPLYDAYKYELISVLMYYADYVCVCTSLVIAREQLIRHFLIFSCQPIRNPLCFDTKRIFSPSNLAVVRGTGRVRERRVSVVIFAQYAKGTGKNCIFFFLAIKKIIIHHRRDL